jgi:hypothetical protein
VLRKLRDSVPQIGFIGDVVAPKHARGFVAGDLHRDLLTDASTDEVPHRSASEVVHDLADDLGPHDLRERSVLSVRRRERTGFPPRADS